MSKRTKAQRASKSTHDVVLLINAAHGCFLAGEKDDYTDGSKQHNKGAIIKPRDNLISAMAAPKKGAAAANARAGIKGASADHDASSTRAIRAIIPDPVKGLNDKALYLTCKTRCSPKAVVAHRVALAPHRDKKVILVGIGPGCENMIASYMGQYKDVHTGTMHSFREGPEATTKSGKEAWAALPMDDCITHWRDLYSQKSRATSAPASAPPSPGTTSGCVVGMIFMNPICATYNKKTEETEDASDRFPARLQSLPAGAPPILILAGDKGNRNPASLDALCHCVAKVPCKGTVTMHVVEGSDNNPFDSTPMKDCKRKNLATQNIVRMFVNACLDKHGSGGGSASVEEEEHGAATGGAVKTKQGKKKRKVDVATEERAAKKVAVPAASSTNRGLSRVPSYDDLDIAAFMASMGTPPPFKTSLPAPEVAGTVVHMAAVERAPFLDVSLAPLKTRAASEVGPALDTGKNACMMLAIDRGSRRDVPIVSDEESAMSLFHPAIAVVATKGLEEAETEVASKMSDELIVAGTLFNFRSSPCATASTSSSIQSTSPPLQGKSSPAWASTPRSALRSSTVTFEDQLPGAQVEAASAAAMVATPAAASVVGAGVAAAGSSMMANYMAMVGLEESTASMTGPKGFTTHFALPRSALNVAPFFMSKGGSGSQMMGRGMVSPTSPSLFSFGGTTLVFGSATKTPAANESAMTPVNALVSQKARYVAIAPITSKDGGDGFESA